MENTCPHTASTDYRWSERGPFPEQQVHLTIHESQIVSGPTTEERSGRGSHLPLFSGQVRHLCSKEQTASRNYTSAKNKQEPRSVDGSAGPTRRASTCQPAKLSGSGRGLCSQHHLEHASLGGPSTEPPSCWAPSPAPPREVTASENPSGTRGIGHAQAGLTAMSSLCHLLESNDFQGLLLFLCPKTATVTGDCVALHQVTHRPASNPRRHTQADANPVPR